MGVLTNEKIYWRLVKILFPSPLEVSGGSYKINKLKKLKQKVSVPTRDDWDVSQNGKNWICKG